MRIVSILPAVFALGWSHYLAAQDVGCGPSVTVDGSGLEVASEAGNDTENLQCALDAAADQGFTSVLLTDASYSVGAIDVTGFSGSLTGASKSATTLNVEAGSVDCGVPDASALAFYVGAPTINKMTISAGELCGGTGEQASVIGFYSNAASCDSRTAFGNVDRVVIQGPGSDATDLINGVVMTNSGQCDSKVLGTLKVNRSEIDGLAFGVISSIGGAGQVDVNFNTFTNMGTSIVMANANQGSSIAGNTVAFNDAADYAATAGLGSVGVLIGGDANSPSSNLSSLKNNKFTNGGATESGVGILIGQVDSKIDHSVWVNGNRFTGLEVTGGGNAAISNDSGPADPIEFSTDFEEPANPLTGGPLEGWSAYINVFDISCASYSYGYPYNPLDVPGVAEIAAGATSQVLNVYSDYNNGEGALSCLESNVFRELIIEEGNLGTYSFTYDVELPPDEFRGDDVEGFIKVLDQELGYADIGGVAPVASTEGTKTLEITLTDNMVGKLLQFGFATTVARAEPSGMYYDNVVFEATSSSGGGDNGGGDNGGGEDTGPSGGSGYGIAVLNTDGVLVSGNRFIDGAGAWVAAAGGDLGTITGWSVVDNAFQPSNAAIDVSLGSQTSGAVVGRNQDNPRVSNAGSGNDVLEGGSVSGDSEGIASDIETTFTALWAIITGS
ncbi:MAG: hypothetical protein PVJ95_08200 [Cellvibrionales bacterium]